MRSRDLSGGNATDDVAEGGRDVIARTWRTLVKHGGAPSRSHCEERWPRLEARRQGHPEVIQGLSWSVSRLAIPSGASRLIILAGNCRLGPDLCCRYRCCRCRWYLKTTPHEVANDAVRMPRLYTAYGPSSED